MENFYSQIRNFKLPKKSEIKTALLSFSKKEMKVFAILVFVLFASTLLILGKINRSFMVDVPIQGGSFSEGIIGTPRFVNPILAISDADKDLVSLVYSGLMRKSSDDSLIPDLAEKYEVSKDGLTYTFTLKDDIYFHDGEKVSVEDVMYTINAVKDPIIKSPKKGNWDGVSVEQIDDKTIVFTLKQPYASFLENATLGIMPMHVWQDSPVELNKANIEAIGSGPYKISNIDKKSSGIVGSYKLTDFKKFVLGKPHIKSITLNFYSNEDELLKALNKGDVEQIGSITPENAEILEQDKYRIESSTLPRVFGLFFNPSHHQLFANKQIIAAIDKALDKDNIVREVLRGYGVAIDDPIPPNMLNYQKLDDTSLVPHEENLKKAKEILAKDGWKIGEDGFLEKTTVVNKKSTAVKLEFSISTGNAIELAKGAQLIQKDLEEIGMKVDIKTFEIGNLNQGVIRPREYDALLFGQIINHESDLFAFWHSTQRKDPGLNVAMYTNAKVDSILEDAFITVDEQSRIKKYAQFESEVKKDMPAVFIYSPNFIYVVSKNIKGLSIDHINSPSDRFLNSYLWYVDQEHVWKIFAN